MRLHIVGGFLGSGKTTAIARAAAILARRGLRVGVVTNDQGKSLVDSLFIDAVGAPHVEVSGGCFCCRYDDFEERLASLAESVRPDWVFAESVGSCADLVATVLRPIALAASRAAAWLEGPPTFTVFADARLLELRLAGRPLPFSEDLAYLFDRQLEEAGLVVANKADLVRDPAALAAAYLALRPLARFRSQVSRDEASVELWVDELESGGSAISGSPIDVDYARYGRAEAALAWADAELSLRAPGGAAASAAAFRALFASLEAGLRREFRSIGHCKAMLYWDGRSERLSFTTLASPPGQQGEGGAAGGPGERGAGGGSDGAALAAAGASASGESPASGGARAVLNLRVEGDPARLESELRGAMGVAAGSGVSLVVVSLNAFSPSPPAPPPQRVG